MGVLFSSTSGFGHVFPMVPLARAFRAAGHEVLCRLHSPDEVVARPADGA